jgi:hypothetical protein
MSIAQKIDPILLQREAAAAAKAAERAARDSFIQAQFAALSVRFDEMLRTALGFHSRIAVTKNNIALDVSCRSFATLNVPAWTVLSTIDTAPKSVTFTPKMDFSAPDQFGTLVCAIDFTFFPRRSANDLIAVALINNGVRLRGTQFGQLTLAMPDGLRDLSISDLESAFGVWWLRA